MQNFIKQVSADFSTGCEVIHPDISLAFPNNYKSR